MSDATLNILLIDDDEDAYVATRHLLSSIAHCRVRLDWASTYQEGLATVGRHAHDVYLVDYRLDGRDGLELLREAIAGGCRAPMIILTGLRDHEVDMQAMAAGAADYLVKDRLDASHLERCIRYSLERQRLREQLEEKAARLRGLAGQLSQAEQNERSRVARLLHDHLQQIVVSVKMHVDGLSPHNVAEQRQSIQALLDQVLDASRTLAVELTPPILMDAGLAAALTWLADWMQNKHGLAVTADIDPQAEPEAEPVRFMLFHAVRELLMNIVKHAGVKQARLAMTRADDQLEITVADNGAGFDPQLLEKDAGCASAFGLCHLRERIQLVGGQMELTTAPGQGCRVALCAPRGELKAVIDDAADRTAPADRPAAAESEDGTASGTRRRIRVLLVDDHPVLREGLARTLAEQQDLEVVGEAPDGVEAIELTQQLHPDVILMDLVMPRLNGFDATKRITEQWPDVRVIGLSMYSDSDMATVMREAGAVAYVSKGAPIEMLLDHIRGTVSTAA